MNSGSFVEYSYSVQAVKELIVYPIVDKLEQEDISKYFSQIDVDMLDYCKFSMRKKNRSSVRVECNF